MRNLRWLLAALAAVALPVALSAQQPATITGRVTSETGQPVNAASVFIPSINVGTLTGSDGTYTLVVPAARISGGAVEIQAQSIGFRAASVTLDVAPGATITQNFQLANDVLELEGIVATGQGTATTKEKLTTAVTTVKAQEITQSKEQNIVAALAGKAPGVMVTSSSGDPGAGAYIRIRGAASVVGGTQPLFVVDGTPIDNSSERIEGSTGGTAVSNRAMDINPNDIASVEILKGAAATAIYGARGANGVVLITTKSGKPGDTRATYSMSYGRDEVTQTVPLQRSYGQGFGKSQVGSPFSWGPLLGSDVPTYDHAREVYQPSNRLENNLTVSGGSERTTYYLSLGRLDQNGVIQGPQGYVRNNIRLKGAHFLTDQIKVGGNFAYTASKGDFIQQGSNISGIQLGALRTPPDFNNKPYRDPETGLHRSYRNPFPESVTERRGYDNPFWVANEMPNTAEVGRAFGNVSLDYTPTSWLRVSYLLGSDYSSDDRLTLFPKSSSESLDGKIIRGNFTRTIIDSNLTATLTGSLGDNLEGSLTVGQNLNQEDFSQNITTGTTLIEGTSETDFAVTNVGNEYKYTVRTDGYFLNSEVTLADQFTVNATARWDGSSSFGGEGKRFFYPGIGASWAFSKLPVFDAVPFLSFGKLRASFGTSGRQPPVFSNVNAYQTGYFGDGWLSNGLYSIYQGNEGVVSQGRLGNPDIKPEEKAELEAGVDLAFLDQRVALGVTYYDRKTRDAILNLPLATSTGYSSQYDNVAAFDNWGWEATLDVTPVQTENFNWTIGGQYSKNESCVQDLYGTESVYLNGFTGSTVSLVQPEEDGTCHPFGVFYGDDFVRFGRGSEVDGVNIDEAYSNVAAGTIYVGADGLPLMDQKERILGDPNPDWMGAVRSSFTFFNNLTVSGLIDIKRGGDVWNGTKGALYFFGTHKDTEQYHGEGVTQTYADYSGYGAAGPGADKKATFDPMWYVANIGSGFTGPASQFIEDGSFVKLRDISVSYTFTQPFVQRLGMSSVDVTVSGRNLKTWTDYTGIDPESNLTGQSTGRGLDYFNNPQTRSFIFTVNLHR
jgi:TonB-linked SusC/RagA family outer membrane protein